MTADKHLIPYGYAPGDYMNRCIDCGAISHDVDKRCYVCRGCAQKRFDLDMHGDPLSLIGLPDMKKE